MKKELVINKRLNQQGWYWAIKHQTLEEAQATKTKYGIGTTYYHFAKNSSRKHWIMFKNQVMLDD